MWSATLRYVPDDLMTAAEVMALFRVTRQTLYRWRQADKLAAVRVGRLVRYRRSDVEALLSPAPPAEAAS